ncbi:MULTISPECIES: glutamate racemase [Lonsdalea]|uniref:Glutamate racemase n=2 Tax=Lonsdalea TaxID=1082702 RepID=A0ACD1J9Y5_9GAMM|nr:MULTISPECIES: glutamate racemase [Lonsdalea]OSM94010.1 glutamate racemase [Lonsdalea populi]OSM95340.1 glutamate racemase [Lonsdalea populi]QPQ24061.1 glutamate racemase [Lonsdalea populi]RAT11739.1 glutamate racemase [Lonsdalea quercina]RAT18368.1 glutamate racemase [Lonsdalea populi]
MATDWQSENPVSPEAVPSVSGRPTVLILDSGVGGLSVYDEVRKLLPELHYIYAFDNEAFPYGEKPEQFIIQRVLAIVEAVQQRYSLSMVIVACNTASTISLPALRARFSFPVVGVVPAVKPAARLTRNGVVGLLATRGTVQRTYTRELIARFANDCKILLLGSSELVELGEAKLRGERVSTEALLHILKPWLKLSEPPDTVVLGCTHFPLLAEELQQVLPDGTRLVDSGAAIARRALWLIEHMETPVLSIKKNVAFCLNMTPQVVMLQPILTRYGFDSLEKLLLYPVFE